MKTYYYSINGFNKIVITVYEKDDIYEVIKTLDIISKLLCTPLEYEVNSDECEIIVSVNDYYEFKTLQRKLNEHCNLEA